MMPCRNEQDRAAGPPAKYELPLGCAGKVCQENKLLQACNTESIVPRCSRRDKHGKRRSGVVRVLMKVCIEFEHFSK
jgi:hypothetical protein